MTTKHKKNQLSFIILVLFLGLLVTACQAQTAEDVSPQNTPESDTAPEEEVEMPAEETSAAMPIDLELDPAGGADFPLVAENLYETLVLVSEGEFSPWLAESGTAANDGLDYIFDLRPGVFFQDGTMLDADAVIMNFDRWYDAESALRGTGDFTAWEEAFGGFKGDVDADGNPLSSFDGIEKVNDLTILIHLNQLDSDFFIKLSNPAFSILSPTALATSSYVGTGPYTLSEATEEELSLAPFADYWGEVPDGELIIK